MLTESNCEVHDIVVSPKVPVRISILYSIPQVGDDLKCLSLGCPLRDKCCQTGKLTSIDTGSSNRIVGSFVPDCAQDLFLQTGVSLE